MAHDRHGPVAESVDAGAVHRSLSWFESRPGLQPSPSATRGAARRSPKGEDGAKTDWNSSEAKQSHPPQNCRLIAPLKAFRSCGIWSKDTRAQGRTQRRFSGTRGRRALFLCLIRKTRVLPDGRMKSMENKPPAKKYIRRRIDFSRIGNKILVLLYQRYMDSNNFFCPFSDIAAAIATEPRNAVWDELNSLISNGKIFQKTEARINHPLGGILANLGSSNKAETYEVKVDGYKISRAGIEEVNKFNDEIFEVLIEEVVLVSPDTPKKADEDKWEPLPIDRQSTEFAKAIEATDIALKEIESSNGYADSTPDERNSIVETIRSNLRNLK
jgi:hypothetical protein